ncbi:MAG: nicotinate-nucleotide adenylyltransferase [Chromatiales bacterium]|jgi:nicotinate-nucleotide adenylyltransferase|nr:nicotinate-nucleotide adenylyltransferase [Chromatiales bacterium]
MIGILGGTFDPVHYGHLRCALELKQTLGFEQIRFMPAHQPPHRDVPAASAAQRLAMLELAVAGAPGFAVETIELRRNGPSYTVDTLLALRAELSSASLSLILGMDAFLGIESWSRWERLIELAHLVIMQRPGQSLSAAGPRLRALMQERLGDAAALRGAAAGCIVLCPVTQLDISATRIRRGMASGEDMRYLLPDQVIDYIRREQLYVCAISTQ